MEARYKSGSATVTVVEATVVVVPLTVKLPLTIKFEPYVKSAANLPPVIVASAILAPVTADALMLSVLIRVMAI